MSIYTKEMDNNIYWASWRPEDLLPHLMLKMDDYFKKLEEYGLLDLWQQTYNAYYGTRTEDGHVTSTIKFVGPAGQKIIVRANIFRMLLKHILNTVTAMTPNVVPVAANNQYATKAQIYSCKDVLEHYRSELKIPSKCRKAVEYYLLYGMSYLCQWWDEESKELRVEAMSPRRVIFDLESYHDPKWFIMAERINRFDAIAKYNVTDEQIPKISNTNNEIQTAIPGYYYDSEEMDGDYIDIYHFWHARTPALPEGRYTIFVNDKVSFTSHLKETLSYEHLPVHRFSPEEIAESSLGYTESFDLLGPQKLINATLSTIYTGQDKTKSIVAVPSGAANIMPKEVDANLSILEYPAGQPSSGVNKFDLFNVPDQLFKTFTLMREVGQALAGQNDTSMGSSEAKSGSHAALLFTVTQQYQSATIATYVDAIEELSTAQISIIKNFLPGPIMLKIAGEDKEPYMESFKREDIEGIIGVVRAQGVSPLLSTPSGRMSVAQDIMKLPPEERRNYMRLIDTGQLDDSEEFTGARNEDMLLTAEREILTRREGLSIITIDTERYDGIPDKYEAVAEVRALVGQHHGRHIVSHMAIFSSPQVLSNPGLVSATRAHINEHLWLWTWGPRQMLKISGLEPLPPEGGEPIKPPNPVSPNAVPDVSEQALTGQTPNPRDLPRMPMQPNNPRNPTVSGQAQQPPGPAAM